MEEKEFDAYKQAHALVQTVCNQRITIEVLIMTWVVFAIVCCSISGIRSLYEGKLLLGIFVMALCTWNVFNGIKSIGRIKGAVDLKRREQTLYEKVVTEKPCDSNIT